MWIEILLPVCCAAKGVGAAEDVSIHDLRDHRYDAFASCWIAAAIEGVGRTVAA